MEWVAYAFFEPTFISAHNTEPSNKLSRFQHQCRFPDCGMLAVLVKDEDSEEDARNRPGTNREPTYTCFHDTSSRVDCTSSLFSLFTPLIRRHSPGARSKTGLDKFSKRFYRVLHVETPLRTLNVFSANRSTRGTPKIARGSFVEGRRREQNAGWRSLASHTTYPFHPRHPTSQVRTFVNRILFASSDERRWRWGNHFSYMRQGNWRENESCFVDGCALVIHSSANISWKAFWSGVSSKIEKQKASWDVLQNRKRAACDFFKSSLHYTSMVMNVITDETTDQDSIHRCTNIGEALEVFQDESDPKHLPLHGPIPWFRKNILAVCSSCTMMCPGIFLRCIYNVSQNVLALEWGSHAPAATKQLFFFLPM